MMRSNPEDVVEFNNSYAIFYKLDGWNFEQFQKIK